MAETEKLSASQRAKVRRLSAPKELAPDEEGGELNIVPFLDIVTNVLMFVLATVSVTFTATIDSYPPRAGGGAGRTPTTKTLSLTVIIVNEGFSIKASGGNVAPGCSDTGPGLAIPKKGNDYDFEGLRDCAAKLKSAAPEFESEEQVTIPRSRGASFQRSTSVWRAEDRHHGQPAPPASKTGIHARPAKAGEHGHVQA
jgi:biopolymer transport protein TolR